MRDFRREVQRLMALASMILRAWSAVTEDRIAWSLALCMARRFGLRPPFVRPICWPQLSCALYFGLQAGGVRCVCR